MTSSDLKLLSINQINEGLTKCPSWALEDNGRTLVRSLQFDDFRRAVDFLNEVAKISEFEDHHPDLRLFNFKNLEIRLTTHSVNGLTRIDFDVAEGIDNLKS